MRRPPASRLLAIALAALALTIVGRALVQAVVCGGMRGWTTRLSDGSLEHIGSQCFAHVTPPLPTYLALVAAGLLAVVLGRPLIPLAVGVVSLAFAVLFPVTLGYMTQVAGALLVASALVEILANRRRPAHSQRVEAGEA